MVSTHATIHGSIDCDSFDDRSSDKVERVIAKLDGKRLLSEAIANIQEFADRTGSMIMLTFTNASGVQESIDIIGKEKNARNGRRQNKRSNAKARQRR